MILPWGADHLGLLDADAAGDPRHRPHHGDADKTTTFGKWVEQFCGFSERSAFAYCRLYNGLRESTKLERAKVFSQYQSQRAVTSFLADQRGELPEIPATITTAAVLTRSRAAAAFFVIPWLLRSWGRFWATGGMLVTITTDDHHRRSPPTIPTRPAPSSHRQPSPWLTRPAPSRTIDAATDRSFTTTTKGVSPMSTALAGPSSISTGAPERNDRTTYVIFRKRRDAASQPGRLDWEPVFVAEAYHPIEAIESALFAGLTRRNDDGLMSMPSERVSESELQAAFESMWRATIRAFLQLPPEAMPSAQWVSADPVDMGEPWPYLRDAILPEGEQQMNHLPLQVRLSADRDGWRDGVIVTC